MEWNATKEEATRMGTKSSGIEGHIRGWHVGARVVMRHENGKDVCTVYRTRGSSGGWGNEQIAQFTDE